MQYAIFRLRPVGLVFRNQNPGELAVDPIANINKIDGKKLALAVDLGQLEPSIGARDDNELLGRNRPKNIRTRLLDHDDKLADGVVSITSDEPVRRNAVALLDDDTFVDGAADDGGFTQLEGFVL